MRIVHQHDGAAYAVAYSPDSALLVSGGKDGVRCWPPQGNRAMPFAGRGRAETVWSLAFSSMNQGLVVVGDAGTVQFWSLPDGRVLEAHVPQQGGPVLGKDEQGVPTEPDARAVWNLVYHHERRLAAGAYCVGMSGPNYVLLWELGPSPRRRYLWRHTGYHAKVDFSPTGRLVASGTSDKKLFVGDTATALPVATWASPGCIHSLLFLDESTLLAGVGFGVLCLDVPNQRTLWKLPAHRKPVTALGVSSDRRALITGSEDGTVAIWDLTTRRPRYRFELATSGYSPHAVTIAPNGETAAVACRNGDVAVIDLD